MVIEINGQRLVNPDWQVDRNIVTLRLETGASFGELLDDFGLGEGDVISQYNDNDYLIGEFHVLGLASIQVAGAGSDPGLAEIRYRVSQIGLSAQEALESDIGDTSDALLELAAMIADMDAEYQLALENFRTEQTERLTMSQEGWESERERLNTIQNTLNSHNEMFVQIQNLVNGFADRIAVIENQLNGGN